MPPITRGMKRILSAPQTPSQADLVTAPPAALPEGDRGRPAFYKDLSLGQIETLCSKFGVRFFPKNGQPTQVSLNQLAARYRLHHPYYEYMVPELKLATKLRGLTLKKDCKKQDMVAALEASDASTIFPQFLELPAEIRNMIYTFHFLQKKKFISWNNLGSYGTGRGPLAEPPITYASHQLRNESRAVFYAVRRFPIQLWSESSPKWVTNLKPDVLSQLRAFSVQWSYQDIELDLNLIVKGSTFILALNEGEPHYYTHSNIEFLSGRLSSLFETVEVGKLTRSDIEALLAALDRRTKSD